MKAQLGTRNTGSPRAGRPKLAGAATGGQAAANFAGCATQRGGSEQRGGRRARVARLARVERRGACAARSCAADAGRLAWWRRRPAPVGKHCCSGSAAPAIRARAEAKSRGLCFCCCCLCGPTWAAKELHWRRCCCDSLRCCYRLLLGGRGVSVRQSCIARRPGARCRCGRWGRGCRDRCHCCWGLHPLLLLRQLLRRHGLQPAGPSGGCAAVPRSLRKHLWCWGRGCRSKQRAKGTEQAAPAASAGRVRGGSCCAWAAAGQAHVLACSCRLGPLLWRVGCWLRRRGHISLRRRWRRHAPLRRLPAVRGHGWRQPPLELCSARCSGWRSGCQRRCRRLDGSRRHGRRQLGCSRRGHCWRCRLAVQLLRHRLLLRAWWEGICMDAVCCCCRGLLGMLRWRHRRRHWRGCSWRAAGRLSRAAPASLACRLLPPKLVELHRVQGRERRFVCVGPCARGRFGALDCISTTHLAPPGGCKLRPAQLRRCHFARVAATGRFTFPSLLLFEQGCVCSRAAGAASRSHSLLTATASAPQRLACLVTPARQTAHLHALWACARQPKSSSRCPTAAGKPTALCKATAPAPAAAAMTSLADRFNINAQLEHLQAK